MIEENGDIVDLRAKAAIDWPDRAVVVTAGELRLALFELDRVSSELAAAKIKLSKHGHDGIYV